MPPQVKTVPESGELEVELGNEVIMGCVVTGVPTPIVTWSFKVTFTAFGILPPLKPFYVVSIKEK